MESTLELTTETQDICTFLEVPNHAIYIIKLSYNQRGIYPVVFGGLGTNSSSIGLTYTDIAQYEASNVVLVGHSTGAKGTTQTITINAKAIGGEEQLMYCSASLYAIPYE